MARRAIGQFGDEGPSAEPAMLFFPELAAGETLVWTGRPRSVRRLVLRSVPKALFGLAFVGFTLSGDPDHGQAQPLPTEPPGRGLTYRISVRFRLYQVAALAVGGVSVFCLVGNLAVALAALAIMPRIALAALASLTAENGWPGPLGIAGCLAVGVGSLVILGLVTWLSFRFAFATPTEITVNSDGRVEFRSRLRTAVLRASEITSITTGGWTVPTRSQAVIRHTSGKVVLVNEFPDFRNFLATIKALNPAVEIKGF